MAAVLVVGRRVSRFSRCNVVYISQRLLLKGQRRVKSSLIAAERVTPKALPHQVELLL